MLRVLPLVILILLLVTSSPTLAVRCTGSANCRACRTCSSCAHCAKGDGTCGVCSYQANRSPSPSRASNKGNNGPNVCFWAFVGVVTFAVGIAIYDNLVNKRKPH